MIVLDREPVRQTVGLVELDRPESSTTGSPAGGSWTVPKPTGSLASCGRPRVSSAAPCSRMPCRLLCAPTTHAVSKSAARAAAASSPR